MSRQMSKGGWPSTRRFVKRVQLQQRGDMVRAIATLPDGRKVVSQIRANHAELGADELGGKFLRKLKKAGKKVGKVALAPLKLAHKITHTGPLGKLEKAAQKYVGKALPFTKPFINAHNKLAAPVHKALGQKKAKTKVQAQAIAKVTAKLPPAQKKAAQTALAAKFATKNALENVAKNVVKQKVVAAAAKVAKAAKAQGKAAPTAKKVLQQAKPQKGTYKVTLPNGRVVNVPASKVA